MTLFPSLPEANTWRLPPRRYEDSTSTCHVPHYRPIPPSHGWASTSAKSASARLSRSLWTVRSARRRTRSSCAPRLSLAVGYWRLMDTMRPDLPPYDVREIWSVRFGDRTVENLPSGGWRLFERWQLQVCDSGAFRSKSQHFWEFIDDFCWWDLRMPPHETNLKGA